MVFRAGVFIIVVCMYFALSINLKNDLKISIAFSVKADKDKGEILTVGHRNRVYRYLAEKYKNNQFKCSLFDLNIDYASNESFYDVTLYCKKDISESAAERRSFFIQPFYEFFKVSFDSGAI